MYAGSTLVPLKYFDVLFGTHQKIDRTARKHLMKLLDGQAAHFPSAWYITKFEGLNGPDGVKRKAPGQAEPRHFYDPSDPQDKVIIEFIESHYQLLVEALRAANHTRAAFEASWLAHALVDGLTPAHHYPYERELAKLRGGRSIETRDTLKQQLVLPGETLSKQVHNNWKMWGDKGLLATHFAFEMGVAVIVAPLKLKTGMPTAAERRELERDGLVALFKRRAKQIARLRMYEMFYKSGWTPKLAKQVRRQLMPVIINTVTLAWYGAVLESQKADVETGVKP